MKTSIKIPKTSMFLLMAFVLVINSNSSLAQSWPMPGAEWTYCITGWDGKPAGEEIFSVSKDTIIQDKTYTICEFQNPESDSKPSLQYSRRLITRFENDTVYRFVNNQEYVFFTFNLHLGDVFTTFRTAGFNSNWEDSACSSKLPLKVIEEGEIELGGQTLKRFILKDTLFNYLYDSFISYDLTFELVERIGIINTYPLINPIEPSENCNLPSDWSSGEVGKYTDNSFEHLFQECEGVGIEEVYGDNNKLDIFPNPVINSLSFTIYNTDKNPITANIYDINGRIIQTEKIKSESADANTFTISVGHIENGVYLLEIKQSDKYSYGKFVVGR